MLPSFFFAEVVSVHDDEEMIGRAKIRIFGDQDDRGRIPQDNLRWARPIMNPYDSPQYAGVGRGGTGLIPGTRVFGFFADPDHQHPFIVGSVPAAGKTNSPPVESGNMPDGTMIAAGNPYGNKGPLDFHDNRRMLERDAAFRTESLSPVDRVLKTIGTEIFFARESGNGPTSYGNETNILASIRSGVGIVSDMTRLVSNINPNNIGGMPGTIIGLINVAGKLTGLPSQLLGSTAFSAMNVVSSIINVNPTNLLGSLNNILNGTGTLLDQVGLGGLADATAQAAQGVRIAQAISQMTPQQLITGAISAIPLSPIQQVALNAATGAVLSGDPAKLVNAAAGIASIVSPTIAQATSDLSSIAREVTDIVGLDSNFVGTLQRINQTTLISDRIYSLASSSNIFSGISNPNLASKEVSQALGEIQSYASQVGDILNVGDRLVPLAQYPALLLDEIDRLLNNLV